MLKCGMEEDWQFFEDIDIAEVENKSFTEFLRNVNRVNDNILSLLDSYFGHSILNCLGNLKSNEEELEVIQENNRSLRHEIELKLETLKQQQTQYEAIKKDQVLLNKEIKDTHEAFLMAKKYYKKFLRMYFTIELKSKDKQVIFVQFFTETKKDNDNFSLRLARYTDSRSYELLSTSPKLGELEDLQKKLKDTKDVPNLLANIRLIFLSIKAHKA